MRLALTGTRQNASLKLEDVGRMMVANVPDLLVDLVEIATYVYCADQATSRGGDAQRGMGADWRRDFRFIIPVRNPDHWGSREVLEQLRSTLWFLSEDEYQFQFEKAANPVPFPNYLQFGTDLAFKADEVILFSGGLDSLSGVIEELSNHQRRIALVSHRSSSKILDRQKRLVGELKNRFPNRIMHVPVLATRQEKLSVREYTLRSRSFLTRQWPALSRGCLPIIGFGSARMVF
jgi:hypothetical protein